MRMWKQKCLDLRNNSIELVPLKRIIDDVKSLFITNLSISVDLFELTCARKPFFKTADNISILFEKEVQNEKHKIRLLGELRFSSHGYFYRVSIEATASAEYDYEPYTSRLQDYLYTYVTYIINNNAEIQKRHHFTCPDHLENYVSSQPEWKKSETQNFCWIDNDSFLSLDIVRKEEPSIFAMNVSDMYPKMVNEKYFSSDSNGYWVKRMFGTTTK